MEERALNSGPISKGEFLEAIKGPYIEAFTRKNVRKAFETVGTWPVDPSKITRRMLGPSKALSIKAVSVIPQTSPIKHIVNNLTLLASRPTSNPAFLSKDSSTPSPAPDSTPLVCETARLDDVQAGLTKTRAAFLFDGSQASSLTMVPRLELPARRHLIPSIPKLKPLPKNLADLDRSALVSLARELHSDAAESHKHITVLVLNQDTLTAQNSLLHTENAHQRDGLLRREGKRRQTVREKLGTGGRAVEVTSGESMKIMGEHNARQMAAEAKKGGKGNLLVEKLRPLPTKEHTIHCKDLWSQAMALWNEKQDELKANSIPMNRAGDKPCLWWFSNAQNPDFVLASIKNGSFKPPTSSRSHQTRQRAVSDASSAEYHEW